MKTVGHIIAVVLLIVSCSDRELPGKALVPEEGYPSYTISPPGTVIDYSPADTKVFLGSPSIAVLEDGSYVASHDNFGEGTIGAPSTTIVFRSEDKGRTWRKVSSLSGLTWAKLYVHRGVLYIMGMEAGLRPCMLFLSENRGDTWIGPSVIVPWRCHSSSVPVLEHKGRIWRGLEIKNPEINTWPQQFNAMMLSAPADADLMDGSQWVRSNQLQYDSRYLKGLFAGWLEGNAVPAPDGSMKLIMRVQIPNSVNGEKIAIIDVSEDGKSISFNPETGFADMPGGAKKFCVRYDEKSARYWTLSNFVKSKYSGVNPAKVRNVLALCSSENLREWIVHKFILETENYEKAGFQYIDWQVDGEDIVFVSRTAYEDGHGGALSSHDNNFFTFHRVVNFRSLKNTDIINGN